MPLKMGGVGDNGDRPTVWGLAKQLNELKLEVEKRWAEEQQNQDDRVEERLAKKVEPKLTKIESTLDKLVELAKKQPSSASVPSPGIIVSQKQVITGLSVATVLVTLLLLDVDANTIAAWLIKWGSP